MSNNKDIDRGRGRPKVKIDWKRVDSYLKAGCTGTGIADMIGIAAITLYRACERDHKVNFDAYSQQKRETGDDMLRAKQFDVAMKGDKAMLVWLGKQRLGQHENPVYKVNMKVDGERLITGFSPNELVEILSDDSDE